MTAITRAPIPAKARDRSPVPWRFTTAVELDADQVRAMAAVLLDGTEHHVLIQAYGGFGTTIFEGDYWNTKGRGKDLSQVAKRWELVQETFPELIVDAVVEHRVPEALQDVFVTEVPLELEATMPQAPVPAPPAPIES